MASWRCQRAGAILRSMPEPSPLTGPPVTSIDELLARMAAIDAALPPSDGVACFNRMYRQVTVAVQAQLTAGFFTDQAFTGRLDVVFGNLYLVAVNASVAQPAQVPKSWDALLERRGDARIAPLQFALAGMNAHINHDLPIAIVDTCVDLATTPGAGEHYADFERVNTVLAAIGRGIRASFESGLLLDADRAAPIIGDITVNFDLAKARETAWGNGLALWTIRQTAPALEPSFLDALDHLVGFAGRGLLTPLLGR